MNYQGKLNVYIKYINNVYHDQNKIMQQQQWNRYVVETKSDASSSMPFCNNKKKNCVYEVWWRE